MGWSRSLYVLLFLWCVIITSYPENSFSQSIDNGLVSHWTFDNDEVYSIRDQTPNLIHGIPYNIVYGEGPVSRAAFFNGTNSRILFPDINSAPPDTISTLRHGSISLWFIFENKGGDILPMLYFGESNEAKPHKSLIIEIGHNNDPQDRRLYFTIIVAPFDVTRFCFDSGKNLDEGIWYHFVAVVGPDGNTGFLNGAELSQRRYNLGSNASYTDFFASVPENKMLALGYGRYGRNSSFFYFKGGLCSSPLKPYPMSILKDIRAYGMRLPHIHNGFRRDAIKPPPNISKAKKYTL